LLAKLFECAILSKHDQRPADCAAGPRAEASPAVSKATPNARATEMV